MSNRKRVSIQLAYYTLAQWTAWNGVLLSGQVSIVSDAIGDAVRTKIGDGVTTWTALPYYNPASSSQTLQQTLGFGNTSGGLPLNMNDNDEIQLGNSRAIVLYYHAFDQAGELRHTVTLDEISFKDAGGIELTSATGIKFVSLTADTVPYLNSSKQLVSGIPSAYLDATSSIQTQLNNKLSLSGGTMTGDILSLSGFGLDTTATVGTDTLNIGATNADVINIGRSGATVNILGTALYEYAANQYVLDKLITLNYSGAAASGVGVGFEIEENNVITGYFKTNSARNAFEILTPANANKSTLGLDLLTADRTHKLPNESGTLLVDTHFCKKIAYNYTPVSGTNVITQEILHAHQIDAGTVLTGDVLKIYARLTQNNSGGTKIYRVWINSSNSLTGAVQIGQYSTQTTNILQSTERYFPVLSDTTLRGAGAATSAINGEWTSGAFTPTTFTTVSLSAGFYILITGQKSNGADTDTVNASWVELVR